MTNLSSQPEICTGGWAWWCSWHHWSHGEDFASVQTPVVGRHSLVPEDWELVQQDYSSSVGLVVISCSLARSTPRLEGNGSHSLHGCIQLGLGNPVRVTLDTGTVVCISKVVTHKRFGDTGRHQRRETFPSSSETLGGLLVLGQRSHGDIHQAHNPTLSCI